MIRHFARDVRCYLCDCPTRTLVLSEAVTVRPLWLCEECKSDEFCIRCNMPTVSGIYIRAQKKGAWGSHQICGDCWNAENPNREPIRLRGPSDVN